jgi:hypothetical protein
MLLLNTLEDEDRALPRNALISAPYRVNGSVRWWRHANASESTAHALRADDEFETLRQRPTIATVRSGGSCRSAASHVKQSLVTNLKTCPDGLKHAEIARQLEDDRLPPLLLDVQQHRERFILGTVIDEYHLQRKTRAASSF